MVVQFVNEQFGIFNDKNNGKSIPIRRFIWKNSLNLTIELINYGATITSIKMPDKNGKIDDIVLGFNNIEGYLNPLNPYFGAIIGRVANRIKYGEFKIENITYNVTKNHNGIHQLHGGNRGFDKVIWNYFINGKKVILTYLSGDNEEGFPGECLITLIFELTDNNEFKMDFFANTTKATYINLTNHSYFNLAGHDKGPNELLNHQISINADQVTDVDKDSIPTGNLLNVSGTIFDLRIPKILKNIINNVPQSNGYDHNFCINKGTDQDKTFIAKVYHPESGRILELYSDQPGVQFYTGNFLPEINDKKNILKGKNNAIYNKHGAFCLETQNYPDAINHKNFPKAILYPGEAYKHSIIYKFISI